MTEAEYWKSLAMDMVVGVLRKDCDDALWRKRMAQRAAMGIAGRFDGKLSSFEDEEGYGRKRGRDAKPRKRRKPKGMPEPEPSIITNPIVPLRDDRPGPRSVVWTEEQRAEFRKRNPKTFHIGRYHAPNE